MKCEKCGKEVALPFRCPYCGGYFCAEHRLPENHDCPRMDLARAPKRETRLVAAQKQKQKQKPYEYAVTYAPLKPKRRIRFSKKEIEHLTAATLLVIGVVLSLAIRLSTDIGFLVSFSVIITASFLLHEMAHKITAQKYGFWAEFRIFLTGAILTGISIITPFFKIISPGAVVVAGFTDRESGGKISVAGPLTNIVLSMIFLGVAFSVSVSPFYFQIFMLGAAFNAWIALFNLIPFGILDGFKIFLWDKKVWALAFTASLILTIVTYRFIL